MVATVRDDLRAYKKLAKAFEGHLVQLAKHIDNYSGEKRVTYSAYTDKGQAWTTVDKDFDDPMSAVNYLIEKEAAG